MLVARRFSYFFGGVEDAASDGALEEGAIKSKELVVFNSEDEDDGGEVAEDMDDDEDAFCRGKISTVDVDPKPRCR